MLETLPAAQRELWASLAPAAALDLVLYGGTAIALQLGHRQSIDFDFFSSRPLDKAGLRRAMPQVSQAAVLQDEPETLVVSVKGPDGPVKLSFFGGLSLGRVGEPRLTIDGVLLVASPIDLLATKLKAILDRAEAKDYIDLAALLRSGLTLADGLAAFRTLFSGEPAVALKAIGYFGDGDLTTLTELDRRILREARDSVGPIPDVTRRSVDLA
jgi:hypothetical protein